MFYIKFLIFNYKQKYIIPKVIYISTSKRTHKYTNYIYRLSNAQHNLFTKLQHWVDVTALTMERRNRIHFISNSVFDDLFSATEINEEPEGISGLRLCKLKGCLLKLKLRVNRIYSSTIRGWGYKDAH